MKRAMLLVKYNVKLVMTYHMLVCVGIMLIGLFTFKSAFISCNIYYRMNEYVLLFIGPVSLISIADLECREHVWEMVYTKRQSMVIVVLLRLAIVFVLDAIILILPYYLILMFGKAEITLSDYWGCLITAVWFGLVGFTIVEITGSRQIGVCILVVYYLLEVVTGGMFTNGLTLVGYVIGKPETKSNLLYAAMLLVLLVSLFEFFKVRGTYDNRDRVTQ